MQRHPERSSLHYVPKPRGDKHGKTKLTDAQVIAIRELYSGGVVSQRELGRRFGVSYGHIHKITSGKHRAALQTKTAPAEASAGG